MPLEEEFQSFVQDIVARGGIILLPTDPSVIGDTNYPLDLVARDSFGIAMQRGSGTTTDGEPDLDGGDSAHRTGILAFCGNAKDKRNLTVFEKDGVMVRHPKQFPWNNPKNCSRDQLLAFTAGCWRAGQTDMAARLLKATEDRNNTCQNIENDKPGSTKEPPVGDLVFPHEHMFLRVCAGQQNAHWDLPGQWLLQATIEAVKLQDDPEINQLILECIVCCRLDHFVKHVPDYEARLGRYWGGWRQNQQIADAMVAVIKEELKRYNGFIGIPFPPIPINTINEVINVLATAVDEVKKGNYPHLLDPTKIGTTIEDVREMIEAAMADAQAKLEYHLALGAKLFDIASQVGQTIGQVVLSPITLLGGASSQDMDDIRKALAEISSKLDQMMAFLRKDLGPIIRNEVDAALADLTLLRGRNRIDLEMLPVIQRIGNPKEKDNLTANLEYLNRVTSDIVNDVITAVSTRKLLAPVAVQCFVSVFAAGALLLRHDLSAYRSFVSAWCRNIASTLRACITASSERSKTLKDMANLLPTVADATEAARLIPPTETEMHVYWGYQRIPMMGGGTMVIAYGARLHAFNDETGQWQIDDGPRFRQTYLQLPAGDDFLPQPGAMYTKKPWWPLTVDFGGPWDDRGRDMKAAANQLTVKSHRLGSTLAINEQIVMIEKVIAQAEAMERAIMEAEG